MASILWECEIWAEAMLYTKLYLYAVYGVSQSTQAYNFSSYCNLIGDPTASVYVRHSFNFHFQCSYFYSTRFIYLRNHSFKRFQSIVQGASVVLSNENGQQALAYTNIR